MSYISLQETEDYNCSKSAHQANERFPFDYTNKKVVSILREKSFRKDSKGTDNWIQCAKAAMTCCDKMEDKDIHPGMEFENYFRK
jgi:hypothetical protein